MTEIPEGYRKQGKELTEQLKSGHINMATFDMEVAYLALECGFDELRRKPYPSKPIVLMDWERSGKRVKDEFWQNTEISAYLNEWRHVLAHNIGVKWWLGELCKRFEGDKRFDRVKERLDAFT